MRGDYAVLLDGAVEFPIPMRGNEFGCMHGALAQRLFPIPMRGNETCGYSARTPMSRWFPIPMRGNERPDSPFANATVLFPIPMRGNELLVVVESLEP